jgi:hypothetical protein
MANLMEPKELETTVGALKDACKFLEGVTQMTIYIEKVVSEKFMLSNDGLAWVYLALLKDANALRMASYEAWKDLHSYLTKENTRQ